MSKTITALMVSSLVAAGLFAGSASAAPAFNPQALKSAAQENAPSNVETVRWYGRGGGWGYGRGWGYRRGWGYGGFAAGAIVGGALASGYYYPGPGYYYDPYYAPPPPPSYYGTDDVGYCMSRFKSYDPRSGTYVGYDGRRRPCP